MTVFFKGHGVRRGIGSLPTSLRRPPSRSNARLATARRPILTRIVSDGSGGAAVGRPRSIRVDPRLSVATGVGARGRRRLGRRVRHDGPEAAYQAFRGRRRHAIKGADRGLRHGLGETWA